MDQPGTGSPVARGPRRPSEAAEPRTRVPAPHGRGGLGQRTTALTLGIAAGLVLVALIAAGSRGFQWFDAALIGYAVATVFAVAAITYKYTFWLMRPQTARYFKRGWQLFFSVANFRRYSALVPAAIFTDLLTQQFIRQRGRSRGQGLYRWITHQCIFWGVNLSLLITFPLTFGWLRFTQTPTGWYHMWVVGFPFLEFYPYSIFGFLVIHALALTALLLLVGLVLAFHRRFHDLAQIAVQRFRFDIMPLALLFAIAVTGLALTADSSFLGGRFYWFISLTHEAVVVLWLISLPFGKFFHLLERPATVGIELYWRAGEDATQQQCPRCGEPFAPARFIQDLKATTFDVGQDYAIEPPDPPPTVADDDVSRDQATGHLWWQDFCPDCKRILRSEANLAALGQEGNRFL